MRFVGILISAALAALVGWIFWFPVRVFFFSLIPETAAYAWVGKLIVVVLVAWLGGIALPLAVLGIGIFLSLR